jgi:hypothetical protein
MQIISQFTEYSVEICVNINFVRMLKRDLQQIPLKTKTYCHNILSQLFQINLIHDFC